MLALNSEVILFILVGIINTLFGYAIFCLFTFLGMHYSLAILLATCVGVLFNFKTIGKIVFKNSERKLIGRFILVYVIVYLINILCIKLMTGFDSNMYFNGAIGVFVAAIFSYLLNKYFVFARTA